jgi:stage II sporulation protein D
MLLTVSTYHRPRRVSARARGARRLACVLAAMALWPACAGASTLVIGGAGWGHGVGMSQYGALGYAEHGAGYQAILAHYYAGTTLGRAPANAIVRVLAGAKVARIPLERYVRGVVSAEMPAGWPAQALEAQAIASRTYALTAHAGGSRFDVYSDTRSQVYAGASAETVQTNAAVAATAGQIVMFAGLPATTYFFASSGGMTENIQDSFLGAPAQPWLQAAPDPFDAGPSSRWSLEIAFAMAAARLRGLVRGSFRGIEVLARGVSPRIVSALVLGSRGSSAITGPELAWRLGLRSTWAYFSVRSGARLVREPDRSATGPAGAPAGGAAAAAAGRRGGAQAPAGPPVQGGRAASASATGGTRAQ